MGYPICTGTSASEVGWEPVDPSSVNRYCGGGGVPRSGIDGSSSQEHRILSGFLPSNRAH